MPETKPGPGLPSQAKTASDTDRSAGERSLMERVHAGDPSALDQLLEQYWTPLVAYAARLLYSRDAAEDVVQETVLRVWRGRTQWTPTERLESFLYRITRNLALNERRRSRVRERYRERALRDPGCGVATPVETTERTEIREAIARALEMLPPRRREVFILARYHGHTYREIADIMEISPQTVANQMTAALEELRHHLHPHIDDLRNQGHIRLVQDPEPRDPAS